MTAKKWLVIVILVAVFSGFLLSLAEYTARIDTLKEGCEMAKNEKMVKLSIDYDDMKDAIDVAMTAAVDDAESRIREIVRDEIRNVQESRRRNH